MAGHSQFKNIMHRKGAQDAKRAKMFNKLAREIAVAAKEGAPDPADNPRLRNAIKTAQQHNMPKDRIDRAIKSATGSDSENYEEIRYEGYGPGGVAVIVEALSDNRNRTASEVRSAFSKYGGNLGETGSVQFQFEQVGQIVYPASVADADTMLEAALEAGAENIDSTSEYHEITVEPNAFSDVRDALEQRFGEPDRAQLTWKPMNTVEVDEEKAQTLFKLINVLEDSDDVQAVTSNFEVSEDVLDRLAS